MNEVKVGTLLRWMPSEEEDYGCPVPDLGIVVAIPESVCAKCPHKHRIECGDLEECGREHKMDFSDEAFAVEWVNESELHRMTPDLVEQCMSRGHIEVIS